jgi:CubicO group peptidase (beta-lactamase class C family)
MSLGERLAAAVVGAGVAGGVAGIMIGDEREVAAAGQAGPDVMMRPETRLPVASLTKPMVATAAVRQWQRDGRRLDAPLVDLLPELAPSWRADRRLALTHLLSHTSGLRPDVAQDYPGTLAEAVRETVHVGQLRRLGAAWEYGNAGFALAGYALGQNSWYQSFEQAMAAEIFGPAGMVATSFDPAHGLGYSGGAPVRALYARGRRPGGGVVSTVEDLLRFARFAMADPRSLSATGRAVTAGGMGGRYGLGWNLANQGRIRWHGGDWGGCHSALLVDPGRRIAVAVVLNDDAGDELRTSLAWSEFTRAGGPARPRVAPALWTAAAIARRWLVDLRGRARSSAPSGSAR